MHDEEKEDAVRDTVDGQFYKHLAKVALINMVRTVAMPAIRVSVALCAAFMLHWLVAVGFLMLGLLVFRELPRAMVKAYKATDLDESGPSDTEAANALEKHIANINGIPKGVLPKVSLVITSTLCGAYGWMMTANGGVAVLLFILALLSPMANARIVRRYFKEYTAIMRFMDMSRRPDTPEI